MSVNATSRSQRIVRLTLAVYIPLAVVGAGWAWWRGAGPLLGHPDPWWELSPALSHGASVGAGLALAVLTVVLTRAWARRFRWARALHDSFREILGDLRPGAVVVLALASGIGEELFFRAGLQPFAGWVIASLLFGLVHIGPTKRYWPWTVWAVVMGFLLGAIYEGTGSILGCVLAHVLINGVNLTFIVQHDLGGPKPTRAPSLIGNKERR